MIMYSEDTYFTSSKTTLTDYQCFSTGCCTHVAKTEIAIDNQQVKKSLQRYIFLAEQPKENTEKITNLIIFYFAWLYDAEIPKLCHYVVSSIVFTNIPRSRNY